MEKLTSEESNQFIENHLDSCEDCKQYLKFIEEDFPKNFYIELEKNSESDDADHQLIKDIKKKLYSRTFIAVIGGVLIGFILFFDYFGFFFGGIVGFILLIGLIIYLMK